VHVVFTLPREFAPLALQNKRLIYNLLFHTSAATLLEIARDPGTFVECSCPKCLDLRALDYRRCG